MPWIVDSIGSFGQSFFDFWKDLAKGGFHKVSVLLSDVFVVMDFEFQTCFEN
jgi:hypothetical protein